MAAGFPLSGARSFFSLTIDHRELADLYARCGYGLFRRCLAYLGSEAEAQDAVQEVFARALEAAGRFRPDGEPAAWLRRIADHHCVDLLRRRRRNPVRLDEDGDSPAPEPFDRFGGPHPDQLIAVRRLMGALEPEAARLAILY